MIWLFKTQSLGPDPRIASFLETKFCVSVAGFFGWPTSSNSKRFHKFGPKSVRTLAGLFSSVKMCLFLEEQMKRFFKKEIRNHTPVLSNIACVWELVSCRRKDVLPKNFALRELCEHTVPSTSGSLFLVM